ncbi:tyrosine--tRNA ligase [Candidatus Falkowbacteria bacterium]|nr:tyrosine--tRNA ligase [Candidatus Falkowbacteria bacterium]
MAKKIKTDKKLIEQFLTRGVENIYPTPEALRKKLLSGERLRIYNGIDPTGPTLHLGHMVVLRKLRQLQDLGHEVILLIGDFTAMIGDPTGKSEARKPLTRQQVLANAKGYQKQASTILRFQGMNAIKLQFNSRWLSKLNLTDLTQLATHFTAQQTLARGMFKQRMAEGHDLYLHEFFYPLMQAYDSVAMDVDMEVGGNDQMFNMLAGRTLMKKLKHKEKFVLTTKLLVDPTGKKMGKTEGNMVTLRDTSEAMYTKIMTWSDAMILPAFEMLTDVPMAEVRQLEKDMKAGLNPRDVKARLALTIIEGLVGKPGASKARDYFARTVQQKETPDDLPLVRLKKSQAKIPIVDLFLAAGLVKSKSEARRLIAEKGLAIDGGVVTADGLVTVADGTVLRRGKRQFAQVRFA